MRGQEEHLVLERIGAQRPAVAEHHGLPGAPVVVIDLRAVLVVIVLAIAVLAAVVDKRV
jgi:hypothetical protein